MKEKQKQLLSEMMKEDEKLGLYDESLEEVAEKYANEWEEIHPTLDSEDMTPIAVSKIDFIEGDKWQQKQMYSEEEARKIWYAGQDYWRTNGESITFEELTSNLIRNKNQKSYSAQQVLELMKQAFEAGFKKADIVEAGLEPKETEQEVNWILLKYKNK